MHCDGIHWGECYKWNGEYYPSLHVVVESTRYPKKPGGVRLELGPSTTMAPSQLAHLDATNFTVMLHTVRDQLASMVHGTPP
jgi:hypothetical protein